MTDAPFGAGDDSPMNEGSENTAVGSGTVGEERAAEENDGRTDGGHVSFGADEERLGQSGTAEPDGQPDLSGPSRGLPA